MYITRLMSCMGLLIIRMGGSRTAPTTITATTHQGNHMGLPLH
ncbi:MAG: hypothetical protein ACYSU4_11795 [Planctomycetota bacterium]